MVSPLTALLASGYLNSYSQVPRWSYVLVWLAPFALRLGVAEGKPPARRQAVLALIALLAMLGAAVALAVSLISEGADVALFFTFHGALLAKKGVAESIEGRNFTPVRERQVSHFQWFSQVTSRLAALAPTLLAGYSRYADDLTFSGDEQFLRSLAVFLPLVSQIARAERFQLNTRKRRIIRNSQRQTVTGVVVNSRPNVSRRDYDTIKAILTNCVRRGPSTQNHDRHEKFAAHLLGRITHVAMLGDNETLVHSTIACGGFVVERWNEGSRAHKLRTQLQAIRRIPIG